MFKRKVVRSADDEHVRQRAVKWTWFIVLGASIGLKSSFRLLDNLTRRGIWI